MYPRDLGGWMVECVSHTPLRLGMLLIHDHREHHYDLASTILKELPSEFGPKLIGTFKIYTVFTHVFVTFSSDYVDIGFTKTEEGVY